MHGALVDERRLPAGTLRIARFEDGIGQPLMIAWAG